ncbi:MAG: acetate--CoA ligase family protein [Candidatus Dojkabacteria bacterium]|jgi:acetyl coenzyme A synthetase (ADP forming)-like protein
MTLPILSPKSIAIVGASADLEKIGAVLLKNLITDGYNGKIYPINPKYEELQGRKAYPDILAVEEDIDLVCIAIPRQFVETVIDQCIEKKVQSVVIISAGFKETGGEGKELEKRITQKLKDAGIRLIGPNCLGYINNRSKTNISFARENPGDGNIAFISQSGAFCAAILDMACEKELGFSHIISLGNKADINENELLPSLINDPTVKAIAVYLEEFTDGKEFLTIVQKSKKPILIIAPGSSEKSREAITSHTGSLASSYDTTIAAIKKGNLIHAENSEELFKLMELVESDTLPKGNNVAIVSNAGGPGIIAVDQAEKENINIIDFGEKTKQKLMKELPEESNLSNPIDVLGDAKSDRYAYAINTVLEDINVDAVVVILTPQLVTDIEGTAEVITNICKQTSKPVFTCFLGGKNIKSGVRILENAKVPNFNDIQECMHLLSKLMVFDSSKERVISISSEKLFKKGKYRKEVQEYCVDDEIAILPDDLAINIMDEFKIDYPKQLVTSSLEQGRDFASLIFPVAIKATAEDLAHKTDYKGLFLDIRTITEFEEKFEELKETVAKTTGKSAPNILIQEMIEGKLEIFLGANREGSSDIYEEEGLGFGHLMAVGKGGIFTEVYKDIKHILVPESRENIDRILSETKVSMIIDGYRGKPRLAREKLIDLLEKVQKMLVSYPEIISMDINPVMLTEDRAVVVDIKLYVKK